VRRNRPAVPRALPAPVAPVAVAAAIALGVLCRGAPARAQAPVAAGSAPALEVTVHGPTAGGYTSRTSTDTSIREPLDAASLLDELPSVHIRRLGPEGSFASISVRGSAPSQVGVVLGGIPLTSGADPAFDVGSLPLWPGASFRVYRGFAPAALGTTGYLGGVLSIDPPSPSAGGRSEWSLYGGSFGALKIRVGDLRRSGDVEIGTGLFASRSDGNFPYLVESPFGSGHVTEQRRVNAGQAVVGGIERLSVERPWGHVAALIFADVRHLGVPGTAEEQTQTRFAALSTSRFVAGLEASIHTGAEGAVRLQAWARRESSSLYDPKDELGTTHAGTTASATQAAGFAVGWRGRPVEALTLGVVLDGRGERFAPDASRGADVTEPASRLAAGAGADLEWRASKALTVSATARIDARRDDATGSTGLDGLPLGVSGDVVPTGHLGASYRFADAAVVSAHAGALSRPPSFQELYGNGASLFANPTLQPERAFSADAGVHGDAGTASTATFGYEVVGFATSAQNLITFSPLGRGTFRAINIDRALLGGAEVSATLASHGVHAQVTYTLLLTENLGSDPFARGKPLPGRPEHDLAADASYRLGPARLRYGVDVVAGVLVGSNGEPGYALPSRVLQGVGLAVDVPFFRGLSAGVDVENLFDVRTASVFSPILGHSVVLPVSDFLGFPLPGRSFWGTLRFTRAVPAR
jgi:vitamin B12 transporter